MFRRLHPEGLDDLVAVLAERPVPSNAIAADLAQLAAQHHRQPSPNETLRRRERAEPWCHVRERQPAR